MTKDKLPTTKYNMYNKMEFLNAWRQVVEFYGCQDNFLHDKMPEGYNAETWQRGQSAANVLLQTHLEDSVFQNIVRSSKETPFAKWARLEKLFLKKQDAEVLSRAQTALILAKQGPEESILEHAGKFNRAISLLVDLGDQHVEDDKYICCLFKQSLNLQYTEILRPIEVTKPNMSYDDMREELLRLELAGKVYNVINVPSANVAAAAKVQQQQQPGRGGQQSSGQSGSQQNPWESSISGEKGECGVHHHLQPHRACPGSVL